MSPTGGKVARDLAGRAVDDGADHGSGDDIVVQQDEDLVGVIAVQGRRDLPCQDASRSIGKRICAGSVEFELYDVGADEIALGALIDFRDSVLDVFAGDDDLVVRRAEGQLRRLADGFDGFLGVLGAGQFDADAVFVLHGDDRFGKAHLVDALFHDGLHLIHQALQFAAGGVRIRFQNDGDTADHVEAELHALRDGAALPEAVDGEKPPQQHDDDDNDR